MRRQNAIPGWTMIPMGRKERGVRIVSDSFSGKPEWRLTIEGRSKSKLLAAIRDPWSWAVFRGTPLRADNWAEVRWEKIESGTADGANNAIFAAEDAQKALDGAGGRAAARGARGNPRKTNYIETEGDKGRTPPWVTYDYKYNRAGQPVMVGDEFEVMDPHVTVSEFGGYAGRSGRTLLVPVGTRGKITRVTQGDPDDPEDIQVFATLQHPELTDMVWQKRGGLIGPRYGFSVLHGIAPIQRKPNRTQNPERRYPPEEWAAFLSGGEETWKLADLQKRFEDRILDVYEAWKYEEVPEHLWPDYVTGPDYFTGTGGGYVTELDLFGPYDLKQMYGGAPEIHTLAYEVFKDMAGYSSFSDVMRGQQYIIENAAHPFSEYSLRESVWDDPIVRELAHELEDTLMQRRFQLEDEQRLDPDALPNPKQVSRANPKPKKQPTWVALGDEVVFVLDDGHEHALGADWVLATQPSMKSIFLVRRGAEVSRNPSPGARKAYKKWTAGDEPRSVTQATRPEGARVGRMGRIAEVLYTGPLGGNPPKPYRHKFEGTLPVLTEVADGLIIERNGSRYTVTSRGIVG